MALKNVIYKATFLILIISSGLLAQQQDLWITFTPSDGLAGIMVNAIHESRNGDLWFGTDNGVSRYREGSWQTFTRADGLVSDTIYTICDSQDGILWLGTNKGVSYYQNGTWQSITADSGLANNHVKTIIQSWDSALWFGTWGGGISRYHNGIWQTFTTNDGLVDNFVQALCESSDGALWVGTPRGVSCYHLGIWRTYTKVDGLASDDVHAIYQSSDGAMWFGGWGEGVTRFDNGSWKTFTMLDGLKDNFIQAIYESSDGTVWIGTREGGVSQFIDNSWKTLIAAANELANNNVAAILEAGDGAMWFGTARGVSRYEEAIWKTYTTKDSLVSNEIRAICKSASAAIWFGTDKGVSRYANGSWKTFNRQNGLSNTNVRSIIESTDGTIWIGTWGGGVCYYHEGSWDTITTSQGLLDDWINTIYESSDGTLWFGTWSGINRYNNGIIDTITTADGLVDNWINTICESNDGKIWIGTNVGVNVFNNSNWDTITTADGLIDNWVNTIKAANDGALWFGTRNGVSCYQSGIWDSFATADGLADNDVKTICQSSDGALWFGTNLGGVSHFKDGIWTTFSTIDGLCNNQVNAISESSNGILWLGTTDGVSRFKSDKNPPFIFIIKSPEKVTGNPSPLFVFKGKDYQTEEGKILYSYALVDSGFEPKSDYSEFSNTSYTELPSLQNGKYTFYVRARDRMGNISKPATYTFAVDITHPTAIINYPPRNATISQIVPVLGFAYDDSPIKDFDCYHVYYGKGTDIRSVTKWDTVVANCQNEVKNDTLAIWNTSGLHGSYQLKLTVKDTLDHESHDIISVNIVDVIQRIKSDEGGHVSGFENSIDIYFPPRSLADNFDIQIKLITDLIADSINTDRYRYARLAYDILPDTVILPKKPATLILTYSDSNLIQVVDEKRLSIFRFNEASNEWHHIGGIVDLDHNKISTAITQLGRYGLFENLTAGTTASLSDIACQPRIFSPRGGGHDSQTAISFELGKASNVTIKIYNASGRLVRPLIENKPMAYGNNVFHWDGRDERGEFCVSGLYIVTIQAEEKMATKTVVVLNK